MSQKRGLSKEDESQKVQKVSTSSIWIPENIVEAILEFATEFDRVKCSSVNQMWYDVVVQDIYWEKACRTHWDAQTLDNMIKMSKTWYVCFQEAHKHLNRPAYRYGPGRTAFFAKEIIHDNYIATAMYKSRGTISQDSCIIHDQRIYFIENECIVCLDLDGNVVWNRKHEFCGISKGVFKSNELLEIIIPRRQLVATCGNHSIMSFGLDGKEIWSCVVADLVRDEYKVLRTFNPIISQFVIRNGVIIFAYCVDFKLKTDYAFGMSVEDGTCLWRTKIPVEEAFSLDKSVSSQHRPSVQVNKVTSVGSKVVFAMDICTNPLGVDFSASCLWIVEFANGDFSQLKIERQTLKVIKIDPEFDPPGVGVDALMMFERNEEKELICVANSEIIHFDSKYDRKLLHLGSNGTFGCNSVCGEVFSHWNDDLDYARAKDMKIESYCKFERMWKSEIRGFNWSELIVTPRSVISLNLPSSSHPVLSMFVSETDSGDYSRYPIQDFDQRHSEEIYVNNHKDSRFVMGNDCVVLINRMNELFIFKEDLIAPKETQK